MTTTVASSGVREWTGGWADALVTGPTLARPPRIEAACHGSNWPVRD